MRNRILVAGTVLALSAGPLGAESPAAAPPGPDVHFMSGKNGLVRGVRCATPHVTREQAAVIDRVLEQQRQGRPPGGGGGGGVTIPVSSRHHAAKRARPDS